MDLSEEDRTALDNAMERALADHYHEDLCYCRDWPDSCKHYNLNTWATSAFWIALPKVWPRIVELVHRAYPAPGKPDNDPATPPSHDGAGPHPSETDPQ
ncbi:hypothetical protein [Embleya sp. NPDC059237]|uniref:hypothetical protein n=1 Tax=Embleya sp. NPDC059237 TaxID=3346784 RepID=UPI00369F0428